MTACRSLASAIADRANWPGNPCTNGRAWGKKHAVAQNHRAANCSLSFRLYSEYGWWSEFGRLPGRPDNWLLAEAPTGSNPAHLTQVQPASCADQTPATQEHPHD